MITEDFKNRLEKACLLADNASEAMKAALREYKKSRNTKAGHVDEKLESLRDEIRTEKAQNEKRPQLMANALSEGDVDVAAEIEKEIVAANAQISELEHKLDLLSGASIKGEKRLYDEALLSYRKKVSAVIKTRGAIIDVVKEIDSLVDELDRIREDAKAKLNTTYKVIGDKPDPEMIDLVESAEGTLDVKGHSTGSDDHAKQRYINGSTRGIENTPAGRRLAAQLEGTD